MQFADRELETVKLLKLGPPTAFPELGQSELGMSADRSRTRVVWLKARADEHSAGGMRYPQLHMDFGFMASFKYA